MKKNNKHIAILILVLIFISLNINAQEVNVVDNKGTIQTVNNNQVTSSNTQPTTPLQSDIWFDTLNSEVKIYDDAPIPTGTWRSLSDYYSDNIYNTNGTLTSNRTVNGGGNEFYFSNLTWFQISNTNFIRIQSDGFLDLVAASAINLQTSDTQLTGNISVAGGYRDSTPSYGTAGQILSSTVTGTDWVDNPAVTSGDIKNGVQAADHAGWYILDGRATSSLSATAQAAANALGFPTNLPDAANRVLKHPNGGETIGATGGQVNTTLVQANLPNINFPTATTTTNGNHNHTIPRTAAARPVRHNFDGNLTFYAGGGNTNTSTTGNHNHTVTVSSGGSDQSFERYQPYLVVNTFIYLGL